jgi:hypothetical protein
MQNGYELHSVHFLGFQKLLQRSKKDTQLSYGEEEYGSMHPLQPPVSRGTKVV